MKVPWTTTLGADYAHAWRATVTHDEPTDRPTVLLEAEDETVAATLWRDFGSHGYQMQWCPGPGGLSNRQCPLASGGTCALADRADVVISHLDFTRQDARDTLAALATTHPDTPVLVAAPNFVRARFPEITHGFTALPDQLLSARVLAAADTALAEATVPTT